MQHPGLRERKKQQTRDAIVNAAMELFAERGFDATTIADIAAAADIAPRTFFGYFPSKEAVVFHDFDALFEDFSTRLRDRTPGETAFAALRAWIVELIAGAEQGGGDEPRASLIAATPSLEAHDRANMARFNEVLTACVAEDLEVPPDSLRAQMVAAASIAAMESMRSLKECDSTPERALAMMDEVLLFLEGGLAALRDAAPAGA